MITSNHISSKKRIILIIPNYNFIYKRAMIRTGAIYPPLLSLALLGSSLLTQQHEVRICDLNVTEESELIKLLKSFHPDYVGITFTTPLTEESGRLSDLIKKN